jgi:hypothetical protein
VIEEALVMQYLRDVVLTDGVTILFVKPHPFLPILLRDGIATRH